MNTQNTQLRVVSQGNPGEKIVVDPNRDERAYQRTNGRAEQLQEHFAANYLRPTDADLDAAYPQIQEMLKSGEFHIVIPMKERGPVIRPVLADLISKHGVPESFITVINDGSDEEALSEVRRYADMRLIHRDSVLDAIKWDELLSILHLSDRPSGKGIAVLAGYLIARVLDSKWLIQSDAEVQGYAGNYRCFEHLLYGLIRRPDGRYVKLAKTGRGNERCMAARNMMNALAALDDVIDSAKARRAQELFDRLAPHKWMLTGEFMLDAELAMSRQFATAYLDETVASIVAEDFFARDDRGCTIHVANPNDRQDGHNSERKEAIMQQQISNLVLQMAVCVDPAPSLGIQEIARLNRGVMSRPIVMGWIPEDDGPVQAEIVPNDRIVPSVNQLLEAGLVDMGRIERLVRGA